MELTGKNLIGNEESGKATTTFFAKNPATQEDLSTSFFEATTNEVAEAATKAKHAFLNYKSKSNEERAVFLETIAENILELGDTLIERCMLETALPEARLTGERMRTINQLRLFASVVRESSWVDVRIDTAIPGRLPVPKPDIRQMQIPLGPVGIFGASNFPFAFSVAGGDTVSALAAGCPVVVKAHPLHPGTSELVGKAIIKAARKTNMPDGVFSMVQGISNEVGMAIVNHPDINAIGFTGSFKGGKAIFDAANLRTVPIPVFAEMGSVNPVFILPGALKERNEIIAKGLIGAVTMGVGQFCTNPGLVVTQKSDDANQFLQNLKVCNSENPSGIMLSGQIKNNFSKGTQNFLSAENVSLISSGSGEESGNKVNPKVFSTDFETFINDSSLSEEVFGPVTLNVITSGKIEMLQLASKLEGHLTATIHGTEKDLIEYSELIHILEQKVGRLIFNGYPTGVEVCHSMVHGGPYPATTAPQSTSVGTAAINRFARPVCYQDFPQSVLPEQLKDDNPLNIWRMINGEMTKK
ncbi:MAG: aldehyde dehydrogenase (NADP(+)) [Bacteroidota bacterium]|nr:aldehyde dehydrogenase (NADP(+)) [Odoribacter sp.]MDP3642788.1 aldehyde dehydrogenase (NADP(+)) [Bacteroidota bacterium]